MLTRWRKFSRGERNGPIKMKDCKKFLLLFLLCIEIFAFSGLFHTTLNDYNKLKCDILEFLHAY